MRTVGLQRVVRRFLWKCLLSGFYIIYELFSVLTQRTRAPLLRYIYLHALYRTYLSCNLARHALRSSLHEIDPNMPILEVTLIQEQISNLVHMTNSSRG